MRTRHVFVVLHEPQQRNRLQRFAEPHLVGQDAVDAILVQRIHPVQASNLVVSHLAVLDEMRGGLEADGRLCFGVRLRQQLLILLLFRLAVPVAKSERSLFTRIACNVAIVTRTRRRSPPPSSWAGRTWASSGSSGFGS